ncbi:MAG: hypothetical protein GX203_00660 [Acholeplasmataceae bacterium]|nr:hypothetical protein [Acholeplasmataceae bacterium]
MATMWIYLRNFFVYVIIASCVYMLYILLFQSEKLHPKMNNWFLKIFIGLILLAGIIIGIIIVV